MRLQRAGRLSRLGAKSLARTAGIYCEPSAAAPIAVAARLRREGRIRATDLVVCVVTGHGLKQPAGASDEAGPLHTVAPDLAAIEAALTPKP